MSDIIRKTVSKSDIMDHVDIKSSGCWEFDKKGSKGYGRIQRWHEGKKHMTGAHRASYELFVSTIPEGILVCHSCDNPICCNPKHLFLGTSMDNSHDMIRKGRNFDVSKLSNSVNIGNNFGGIRISILGREFKSYKEAGEFYSLSDNGVRKRFKGKILVL